jgi:NAD(P)-dependent dehydrogenase (short-subunit alcohol dehydrogenase family)
MLNLSGKTALVTGAATRVGRVIAQALAERGCNLILHCHQSRDKARELAAQLCNAGGHAVVLRADLAKTGQMLKLARDADTHFGGVDILVNSAAIFRPTPLTRLTPAELDAFYAVNLKAPYVLSSELGRNMRRRGARNPLRQGVIVNIACLSGLKAWKQFVPYSISKAGLISLTKGLAKLLAPYVRVNAIAPGTVLPPEHMRARSIQHLRALIPLQTIGSPEDVADAVLYLASAPFVTGQVLCVDGGRSI